MKWLLFLFFLILVSCSRYVEEAEPIPDTVDVRLGMPVTLRVNQTGRIDMDDFGIVVTNVVDSRCPTDVECVRAGDVAVDFRIALGGVNYGVHTIKIIGGDMNAIKSIEGYTIWLANVDPYPVANKNATLSEYEVRIVVSEQEI